MVAAREIGWGAYGKYEGPFYRGKHRFTIPKNPTPDEKILSVVNATEGGTYDAINMYDGQVCTALPIQVTQRAYYQVTDVLGLVAKEEPSRLNDFHRAMADRGLKFQANHRGRYRLFFRGGEEVDTLDEQRKAWHLRSSGERGMWDAASKAWALNMAAAVATVWESPVAQAVARKFMLERVRKYAFGRSADVIKKAPKDAVGQAFVAAYLTFAVNNPTRANKHLCIGMDSFTGRVWSMEWLIHVLKELTFGPNINIYPHRYEAIRLVVERLYGIDLPDFAEDLMRWSQANEYWRIYEPREIQEALIALGYDLGPWGADGRPGKKTRAALLVFEQANALPEPDGMPDPATVKCLEKTLEQRGIALLTGQPSS